MDDEIDKTTATTTTTHRGGHERATTAARDGVTIRRHFINGHQERDYFAIFGPDGEHLCDVDYVTTVAYLAGDLELEELTRDS